MIIKLILSKYVSQCIRNLKLFVAYWVILNEKFSMVTWWLANIAIGVLVKSNANSHLCNSETVLNCWPLTLNKKLLTKTQKSSQDNQGKHFLIHIIRLNFFRFPLLRVLYFNNFWLLCTFLVAQNFFSLFHC